MRLFRRVIVATAVVVLGAGASGCDPKDTAKNAAGDTAQKHLDILQALPGIPDGTAPCDPVRKVLPSAVPASGPAPVVPPQAGPVSPASVDQAASAMPAAPTNGPPVAQPPRAAPTSPRTPTPTATVGLPDAARPAAGHKIYVSLGDSFSAGEGSPDYGTSCFDTGTDVGQKGRENHCHRSQEAYPVKVWESLKDREPWSLITVACSGGVMNDYYQPNAGNFGEKPQRDALRNGADLVTLTMGGNDGGFASVLEACLRDVVHPVAGVPRKLNLEIKAEGDCGNRINVAADDIERMTDRQANNPPTPGGRPGHLLHDFYADVRDAAPKAKILVLGYQQFFPDSPPSRCSTGVAAGYFTRDMMVKLNKVVRSANDAIEKEALAAGLGYVDNENIASSTGNTLCQDDGKRRMQNRFIYTDYKRSFHPSISAHAAEAELVLRCVQQKTCGGEPAAEPAPEPEPAEDVWAYGTSVDAAGRKLTYDQIEWFTGPASTKACKEDGQPIGDYAMCHDYYIRNKNPLKRTAALSNSAKVTLRDLYSGQEKPAGLQQLASAIKEREPLLILTIRNGEITRVREQFLP